jgi:uncharacterized repeat protein (TIGR03803 family)
MSITAGPVAAQSIAVLHSFAAQEQLPRGLIQASDGNFYGTTSFGGANSLGSVFKVTPTGTLTTLYSFRGVDGSFPHAHNLVQGVDGNLYGTTSSGGPGGNGTVFRITPEGILAMLHSFNGVDGSFPNANLVQGTDGNFYGTTVFGGDRSINVNGRGTVFSITPTGALRTLHSFSAWGDGANPGTGLVQGTDGSFYGTTTQGGTGGSGTVFKITPSGALTTLLSFAGREGSDPYAGLLQGADGNFYGTTTRGGTGGSGTVFKITPSGALTSLHSFTGSDGANPFAGLVQGTDGDFYGTTHSGGTNSFGTVFKITPLGVSGAT